MPARIAAIRVQNQWSVQAPYIRCVVHLTRSLGPEEAAALSAQSGFVAADDVISYICRPEEVEDTEHRLSVLLRRIHEPAEELVTTRSHAPALDR